jgi:hypothetical protein
MSPEDEFRSAFAELENLERRCKFKERRPMTTETPDYMKTYADHWAEIVQNPDGTLNPDQVARELADYDALLGRVIEVYLAVTEERVGNPAANPQPVIDIVNERVMQAATEADYETARDLLADLAKLDDDRTYTRAQVIHLVGMSVGGCSCCWAPDAFEPLEADRCAKCGHEPEDHGWNRE